VTENLNNSNTHLFLAKAVAAVAGELNIARRNWAAYPASHPVVETSLQKLLAACRNLLQQRSPVQIGVTRDGLLLGEEYVDKGNIICRSVAAAFFELGAGMLVVRQEPRLEEMQALLSLMKMKREDIIAKGGIVSVSEAYAITFLEFRGIRYDLFIGTEESSLDSGDTEEAESLWERFARLMMQGADGFEDNDATGGISPEVLAASLNFRFTGRMGSGGGFSTSIFRQSLDLVREILSTKAVPALILDDPRDASEITDEATPESPQEASLHSFILSLDPTLRRHILDGFFETGNDSDSMVAEKLFRRMGTAMVENTYATTEEYSAAPTLLQGILRKLAPHMAEVYKTTTPQEEIRNKVRTLLEEHRQETYVSDEYLLELKDLLTENQPPQIENSELSYLLSSLRPADIEIHASEIIMQLVVTDPDGIKSKDLIQNLADMCCYFLQLGDYGQVLKLLWQAADSRLSPEIRIALRDILSQREFLDEILSGLTIWGKSKYDQVTQLIRVIGRPFIDPLLDRLAVEDNMSMRRFLMDRVVAFGEAARPALVARLTDERWYVLRNIITMLRTLAPGQEVAHLRPLLNNANMKVRNEVVKSLLLAGDPVVRRQLLRDMDSNDRETQLSAINLVAGAGSVEIVRKLASKFSIGGYSTLEYEIKLACVKALAEIGNPLALPELVKVLKAFSLFANKTLNRLKIDVVKSLERYPAKAALPILEGLASGNDALARQATESLNNVRSKLS
jgi:hypothetical protein